MKERKNRKKEKKKEKSRREKNKAYIRMTVNEGRQRPQKPIRGRDRAG